MVALIRDRLLRRNSMQNTGNKPNYSTRSGAAGIWVALLFVLTLCLGVTVANAQTAPPVVESQYRQIADLSGGGFTAAGSLTGGSFAVTPANDVVDRKSTRLNSSHANISYA